MGKNLSNEPNNKKNFCEMCGAPLLEHVRWCPNCGYYNLAVIQPATELTITDEGISTQNLDSIARAYSTTGTAIDFASSASEELEETINLMGTIPNNLQERYGISEVIPEATVLKEQVDELSGRLTSMEERFNQIAGAFEETKKERELFIPLEVWERLPNDVKKIIESIRKCFKRGIPEVCPTNIRKALGAAIFIRFNQDDKRKMLYDEDGNPYSYPTVLELARKEGYITKYIFNQLRKEVRVFGDIAAHDYRIDFKEEDVLPLFKLLRLALEQIYHDE